MSTIAPLFTWRSAISESERSATSKHVALALSLYMNERGGSAFPGAERLARDTSRHEVTIRRELGALVADGWLRLVVRGGGKGRANAYEASIPSLSQPMHPATLAVDAPNPSETCAKPMPTARPSLQELFTTSPGESASPSRAKTGTKRRRAMTEITTPFQVTDEMVVWADLELPGLDVGPATREWVTACQAKDLRYVNWGAAWKNAMRRAARWHKTETPPARTY